MILDWVKFIHHQKMLQNIINCQDLKLYTLREKAEKALKRIISIRLQYDDNIITEISPLLHLE
jgi:hypothetical protein